MNQILSDPDDDTKGFFDPNTQENLTYLQLIERCTTDPVTGLSLLVIVKKGEFYFFVDEATKLILKSTTTTKAKGKYRGTTVSLWDLLYSKYITEEKRRELVQQYKTGTITITQFMDIVLKIVEEQSTSQIEKTAVDSSSSKTTVKTTITEVTTFHGIRKDVTASELLESKIIDEKTFKDLSAGKVTVAEISEKDSVRKYLEGTNSIAGVYLQNTKETLSIYEAKSRVYSHRVPVQVAFERGYFDEEMNQILSDPDDDTKGFFDPNTQENLTYLQLIERCTTDPVTGLSLLVIVKKGEFYFFVDEATKLILKSTTTTKAKGKYRGTTVSLWDLLYSKYITEEKRRELVQQYKTGTITITQFMDIVLKIVEEQSTSQIEKTAVDSSSSKTTVKTTITEVTTFHGIRKDVTASELLESKIIDEKTFKDLSAGKVTVAEISEKDSVRKYLEGTNSIAGVYLQNTKETLSIYEAKSRVYSHRVPVQVAFERGYFDEEMNQILSDPDDDTKGFFDPNTQENLTYLQLIERCTTDPVTGLSLLVIVKKGEFYFFVDEATKLILKSTTTTKAKGKYRGTTVSLWDLLYSKYITEEKRRELVQQYKTGTITITQFMDIVLKIVEEQSTSQIEKTAVDSSSSKLPSKHNH
ncbi:hypothetical protein OJAV_G00110280 [Oryzias javanicus]|uniref:Uncharacterized protein n=1 Tax=Oryzias javanicus TaxID=123683 RepID=A0A437CUX9_ORYJA|nr:hypothetical protein OJAV_G00110280 [Oryzias javanicus]